MFNTHFKRNNTHKNLHQKLPQRNITTYHQDPSCEDCYPVENLPTNRLRNFWNWYLTEYPAKSFSRITLRLFEELVNIQKGEETWEIIFNLIFSISYKQILKESFITI